jgi:hydrogenase nickel incorporation protein HypB
LEACIERVKKLNPNIEIIPISARTGEGIDKFSEWLRKEIKEWNEN